MAITEKGMTFERMNDHFGRAKQVAFDPEHDKFIILSDAHKWDRGETDFFKGVESTYLQALDHYDRNGFTLILLGDIEEGAADLFRHVINKYPDTFAMEKRFLPDRYFRVYGNHDHDWKKDDTRMKLEAIMGGPIPVYPALCIGERIFVVHGHEGDLFSDELRDFSKVMLRLFKRIAERISGKKPSTAENSKRRSRRACLLYEWGKANKKIVVAGHTHLAYLASVSITRIESSKIKALEVLRGMQAQAAMAAVHDQLIAVERGRMEAQDLFAETMEALPPGSLPLYFNSGCCKYSNGLTGLEIADGKIDLVRWTPNREVMASKPIKDIRTT
jgi:predicted phosphodiesterase